MPGLLADLADGGLLDRSRPARCRPSRAPTRGRPAGCGARPARPRRPSPSRRYTTPPAETSRRVGCAVVGLAGGLLLLLLLGGPGGSLVAASPTARRRRPAPPAAPRRRRAGAAGGVRGHAHRLAAVRGAPAPIPRRPGPVRARSPPARHDVPGGSAGPGDRSNSRIGPRPTETRSPPGMEIDELLRFTVERGASDLHLKVGNVPFIRVDGELQPTRFEALTAADTEAFAHAADVRPQEARVRGHQRGRPRLHADRRRPVPRERLPAARHGGPGDPPRPLGDPDLRGAPAPARDARSSPTRRAGSCSSPVRPAPARPRRSRR